MIIIRYFLLLQLYHWTTFYKQNPWSFLLGVLLFPYHVFSRLMYPPEQHTELVLRAVSSLKSYWELPEATLPPRFIKRRFLRLESELQRR